MPLISVLMSIYNERIDWIKLSVDSILKQTFNDFEFIIVIDNPTLPDEIGQYLNYIKSKDSRVILIENDKNIGLASCLNKGLAVSKGKYIARMDADDISIIDRFEKQIKYIEKTGSDMVSGLRINIDEEGKVIGRVLNNHHDPSIYLPYTNYIVHPSVLMRRDKLVAINGYRNFSKSQDYDLWLRMLSAGYKISILDDYVINYRVRSNSISVSNKLEQYYLSEYQKLLYKQRIKYGIDNYSEEDLSKYIESKKISSKKNDNYSKARECMDKAISLMKKRKISFIGYFIVSFFKFPRITYDILKLLNIRRKNTIKI